MGQPASCQCSNEACCTNAGDVGALKVEIPAVFDNAVDPLPAVALANTKSHNASLRTRPNNDGFSTSISGPEFGRSSGVLRTGDVRAEYVVAFQKDGNAELGLNIDVDVNNQSGAGLCISSISGGLAAEWNARATEGERIFPGDEIIEVNGIRKIQGDIKSMMQSLNEETVRLVFAGCSAQRSVYEGQWQDNVWHGDGVVKRPDGSSYEGQFVNGMAHGKGQFFTQKGSKYEGQWERNVAHGFGKYTYENGSTYEGNWHQNEKSGKGKQTSANGCSYEGEFLKNARHGVGIRCINDLVVYEGQWREDEMDGEGKFVCPDGRTLTGQWQGGEMNGRGQTCFPSGSVYEGEYLKHKKHGEGTFTWSDGRVYSGQWRNGKQDGTGTLTDVGGICLGQRTWRDGKRVDVDEAAQTTV